MDPRYDMGSFGRPRFDRPYYSDDSDSSSSLSSSSTVYDPFGRRMERFAPSQGRPDFGDFRVPSGRHGGGGHRRNFGGPAYDDGIPGFGPPGYGNDSDEEFESWRREQLAINRNGGADPRVLMLARAAGGDFGREAQMAPERALARADAEARRVEARNRAAIAEGWGRRADIFGGLDDGGGPASGHMMQGPGRRSSRRGRGGRRGGRGGGRGGRGGGHGGGGGLA